MARLYRRTLKSWLTWICRLTTPATWTPPPSHSKCIVLKKLMQLPEACPLSLHSWSHPHSSPPALCECRRCISQSGWLLISHSLIRKGSLSLSIPSNTPLSRSLSPPPPLHCLVWRGEKRGRAAASQRQPAHPSITPAGSLRCWALSSTTQLLPSIKTYRWAGMHTHTWLSQTRLSRPVRMPTPIYTHSQRTFWERRRPSRAHTRESTHTSTRTCWSNRGGCSVAFHFFQTCLFSFLFFFFFLR